MIHTMLATLSDYGGLFKYCISLDFRITHIILYAHNTDYIV